jgi:DNA-binding MarR family transcriptional regulator
MARKLSSGETPATATPAAVADRLHAAAIHLLRRLRLEDEASGLSPARASALSVLVFGGPRPLGALAAAEGVTAPTMSRLVAALEAAGLVARAGDRADRRVARLRATAKGGRLLARARRRRLERLVELLGELDARQLAVLDEAAALIEGALAAERRRSGR